MRLDASPLADAGLFAITGRTGSGKSTTLDALCLALFDRMPRLPAGRGVEVGRSDDLRESRLRNNDVRSILRRGTGEGCAEVDFCGVDGHRYRARWSVRRARERANGRFQAQTMGLEDLESGEDLSGNKTEVLDAIQTRLGLTFDQFRRSVLLPQGDFAAFLRADAGERAELLERITGTSIYGEISKAAHKRAAEEQKRLELVRQRLGDQRPLEDEQRRVLEIELAAARRSQDEQLRTQQVLRQAQRWYQDLDKLAADRDQAAEQLARARGEESAAESRRQGFQRIQSLQPLRLHLTAFDRMAEAREGARRELDQSSSEEGGRQSEADRAAAEAMAAEAASKEAQRARRDAIPTLQAARRLDTEIQVSRDLTERAGADRDAAQRTLQDIQTETAGLQTREDQAADTLGQAQDWLAAHAGIEPLAAHWGAWARELERYGRARETLDTANAAIDDVERASLELEKKRGASGSLIAQIGADRRRLVAKRSDLETRASAFDPNRLAKRREERLERRDRVARWLKLAEQAKENRARIEDRHKSLSRERERQAKSDARLTQIDAETHSLGVTLAEAEETHRRLLLASAGEVQTLRAQLKEGEPCPVCGAEQHPWAQRAKAVLDDLAGEQGARVALLKRRAEEMTGERALRKAEIEQAARRGAELAGDLDDAQLQQKRALETWAACDADPLRPADPLEDGLVEHLAAEVEILSSTLKAIAAEEAEARSLQADIKIKTLEIEGLDTRLDAERKKLTALDEEIRAATDTGNRAALERARATGEMGQVLELVAEPLAGIDHWRERLLADPVGFLDASGHEVDAWQRRVKQRDQAREDRQKLAPLMAEARARLQGAKETLARCNGNAERYFSALAALERERTRLLDGRTAEAVELELSTLVDRAQARHEQRRAALARAREALTAARGAVVTRRQALQEHEAAAEQARRLLHERMTAHGISLEELREALKLDHDWIERERLALQALRDACDRSEELLKERERRLDEHRAAHTPELGAEDVARRLSLAEGTLKAAQEHWGLLHGRLGEDDRRRELCREIEAELDVQQAQWGLWESLRGLIGSADGSKFRNFAQGLTLDLLVAHANQHLRDLARRYELQRVPGAEMEIQVVDREMGDEVRSIHSLSGGESFLASLALALGLASLASDRVEVESLFIDEGFGALDADSLDLAIASLDALYGLGRQVGVISHVGTLVERIGVKVQVTKQGGGRSRLEVVTD
jgi:exonuclease SbcC